MSATLNWTEVEQAAALIRRTPIRDDHQRVALRLASPKRANAGRVVEPQADAAHLPLFIAADEPRLF